MILAIVLLLNFNYDLEYPNNAYALCGRAGQIVDKDFQKTKHN